MSLATGVLASASCTTDGIFHSGFRGQESWEETCAEEGGWCPGPSSNLKDGASATFQIYDSVSFSTL
jgi:hypothetical protein